MLKIIAKYEFNSEILKVYPNILEKIHLQISSNLAAEALKKKAVNIRIEKLSTKNMTHPDIDVATSEMLVISKEEHKEALEIVMLLKEVIPKELDNHLKRLFNILTEEPK